MDPYNNNPNPTGNEVFEIDMGSATVDDRRDPSPGDYEATLSDLEKSFSKAGNPMWVWHFKLNGGSFTGYTYRYYTAVTPAAMWKVAQVVAALGLSQDGKTANFTKSDAIGKPALLRLEEETWDGQTRINISEIMPTRQSTPTPAAAAPNDAVPF